MSNMISRKGNNTKESINVSGTPLNIQDTNIDPSNAANSMSVSLSDKRSVPQSELATSCFVFTTPSKVCGY